MAIQPVKAALLAAIASRYDIHDIKPEVSYPSGKFGDFATNVAFELSGRLKRPPHEVATEIAAALKGEQIAECQAVNGFINVTMENSFWIDQLHSISPDYGSGSEGEGEKVEVEFISANPTGPTTIGNARGGFIGDVLSNVLESRGYQVTREYYFNNAGTQISKLIESVKSSAGLIKVDEVQYRGDYIQVLADDFKSELESKTDEELMPLLTQAILQRWIKPAIEKMGIHFDSWFNEHDLIKDGRFQASMDRLRELDLIFERDGAIWLNGRKLGLERGERVLVKSNGDPTYLGPDIAFHDDLFGSRGFDRSIKVLGADHVDQFPSVKAAVAALHPDKRLQAVVCQWLRLVEGGKEVKMSKRLGQFVTLEELVDEVGADVARFMTLMRSADTGIDFDLKVAKEQSQKNPLFYVMYSYARGHSILQQASERGLSPVSSLSELTDEEVVIVRHISRFPELLREIAEDFEVHRLTFYGIELARHFHDLYESEKIIDLDKVVASRRLYFIAQYIAFMKRYFNIIGVTPVERMEAA